MLPGFVDGYGRSPPTSSATSRTGTQFLQQRRREDPAMADVVRARLIDLLPAVARVGGAAERGRVGRARRRGRRAGGYGLNALTRRLNVIGVASSQAA